MRFRPGGGDVSISLAIISRLWRWGLARLLTIPMNGAKLGANSESAMMNVPPVFGCLSG